MYRRKREMNDPSQSDSPPSAAEAKELASIEAELAAFAPGASRLNRDRTMFLAGRASVSCQTRTHARKAAALAWPIGFAATTAAAACLLVALIVEHRELVALRMSTADAVAPLPGPREPQAAGAASGVVSAPAEEPSGPRGLGFSHECLLAMADSGPLSAGSLLAPDEPSARPVPARDWPQYTNTSLPPLPYYKLLRQFQQRPLSPFAPRK
jgi:hypothetical protein